MASVLIFVGDAKGSTADAESGADDSVIKTMRYDSDGALDNRRNVIVVDRRHDC